MALDEDIDEIGSSSSPFEDKTEAGEAFDNLDNPANIDVNARLERDEIRGILVIDELTNLHILPNMTLTTQFKKLTISHKGEGRKEKVQLFQGMKDNQSGKSFLGSMFSKRE